MSGKENVRFPDSPDFWKFAGPVEPYSQKPLEVPVFDFLT